MELSLERITQLLLRTPQGQELQAQQEAENTRQALFVKRARVRQRRHVELPPLAKERNRALDELEAAQRVLEEKQERYWHAHAAYVQHCGMLEAQQNETENKILTSASPLIDEFIDQCRGQQNRIRSRGFQSYTTQGEYSFEAHKYLMVTTTNADSCNITLTALQQAVRQAEALKLENLTETEVSARLEALDASIPPLAGVILPPGRPLSETEEARSRQEGHDLSRATVQARERFKVRERLHRSY